jgi:hypothetical protein
MKDGTLLAISAYAKNGGTMMIGSGIESSPFLPCGTSNESTEALVGLGPRGSLPLKCVLAGIFQ